MKLKKFLTLALAFTLVLSLAACGSKGETEDNNTDQTMTAEELDAKIQDLAAQENAIIEENTDLWQAVRRHGRHARRAAAGDELWLLSACRH